MSYKLTNFWYMGIKLNVEHSATTETPSQIKGERNKIDKNKVHIQDKREQYFEKNGTFFTKKRSIFQCFVRKIKARYSTILVSNQATVQSFSDVKEEFLKSLDLNPISLPLIRADRLLFYRCTM